MTDIPDRVDYWLGILNEHGYVDELIDGPHDDRAGVEHALYLMHHLGVTTPNTIYRCVMSIHTAVEPKQRKPRNV